MKLLVAKRNRKMAGSAPAYVRGSTTRFYEWLEASSGLALPEGPQAWICGDCHVGNFGPMANTAGALAIQVRDLDQTVSNPAHDLIRLGLSLAMAARESDLSGVTTAHMLEHMIDGYEAAFAPEVQARHWTPAAPCRRASNLRCARPQAGLGSKGCSFPRAIAIGHAGCRRQR